MPGNSRHTRAHACAPTSSRSPTSPPHRGSPRPRHTRRLPDPMDCPTQISQAQPVAGSGIREWVICAPDRNSPASWLPAPNRRSAARSHHFSVTRRNLHCVALDVRYPPIWTVISARLSSHATAHKWMICSLITRRGGLGCSLVQTVMDGSPSLAKKKGRDTSCHQHPALHTSSWRFGGPSNNIRGGQAEPVASR
jgi:hypothetical protein